MVAVRVVTMLAVSIAPWPFLVVAVVVVATVEIVIALLIPA